MILSIIIPTYNSEKSIENTLKSLLDQSLSDYEVLIIDNMSSDRTIKIARGFEDSRIKVFVGKDKGIYDAMNKGISIANGDWLYFLGSDDELYDNMVLYDFYKKSIKSNRKIIYGNIVLIGDTGWAAKGQIYDGEFTLEKLLKKNIPHQATFYHKTVFKNNIYNTDYLICADYDLNLRVWTKHHPFYFKRTIAKFSSGGASTKVIDLNFEKSFSNNIVTYFYPIIYKRCFQRFESDISQNAKSELKRYKILRATYLFTVGVYFKFRRKYFK